MDFDDLTINGDYSDYDTFEEEKKYHWMKKFGSKVKKGNGEGE